MDANEFWCRAFLAMWNGEASRQRWKHDGLVEHCEQGADAALAVAQRRGMVTGERTARPVTQADVAQTVSDYLARGEPELERVEFAAERRSGGAWTLFAPVCPAGIIVRDGEERVEFSDGGGGVLRIKWGETMPPRPIEVWLERR